ncbi:MAG: HD domain-containing protein [Lachnospiraceae bacterium]|nr:HD domain-containing protein [Lachnospiraceae bacterium]
MNPTDYFAFELAQIEHPTIRDLVKRILIEKVPQWFFEVNASNSSFYHSTLTGEPIKLCDRTKSAVRICLMFFANPIIREQFTSHQRDYVLAALILHDCALRGVSSDPTAQNIFEHPLLAPYLLPDHSNQLEQEHYSEICRLIASHHGKWNTNDKSQYVLPPVVDNSQFYVHICDSLASKPMLQIDLSDDYSITKRFLN